MKKVFNTTKAMSVEISKETGVEPSLQEKDIKDYLAKVIKETRQTTK